ncbi:hypothetical protein [Pseudoalteromonas ruthenica]|uniref:hypothetical protein n=1 Tax=Pseudoalteromonas ruthenica TaxID=151081 RepID=UPI00110B9B8D|nr:hypothetical protein [Pseudoalteromonas ruthenica]
MRFLILLVLFAFSFRVVSCPIENRSIIELFKDAEFVFEGAIVEKRWTEYESFVISNAGSETTLLNDAYLFRAIPIKIFKGTKNVPLQIVGGNCNNAVVEGRKRYLLFVFEGGSESSAFEFTELTEEELAYLNTAASKKIK